MGGMGGSGYGRKTKGEGLKDDDIGKGVILFGWVMIALFICFLVSLVAVNLMAVAKDFSGSSKQLRETSLQEKLPLKADVN